MEEKMTAPGYDEYMAALYLESDTEGNLEASKEEGRRIAKKEMSKMTNIQILVLDEARQDFNDYNKSRKGSYQPRFLEYIADPKVDPRFKKELQEVASKLKTGTCTGPTSNSFFEEINKRAQQIRENTPVNQQSKKSKKQGEKYK